MNTPGAPRPKVGLSLMPTADFLAATYPTFEAGEVEVLEYSFDVGWQTPPPSWVDELVDEYALGGCLIGHGVMFSALSAEFTPRHEAWLANLAREVGRRKYTSVSEHFGFMTAGDFEFGAPLPVPYSPAAVQVGRERLKRIADIAGVPVGLENLALCFGVADLEMQGRFIDELLDPVDGYLVLDLHNLFCQVANFGRPAAALLDLYPLHRVRELHLSGGSWQPGPGGARLRRDTHDGPVPDEVFELLPLALSRCPGVQAVILERLGDTLASDADRTGLAAEFAAIRRLVAEAPRGR